MPDFTRDQLEVRLSRRIGDYFLGALSANGAADGTTIISEDLLLRPGNSWVPYYAEITSGDSDDEVRQTQEYAVSGTTATLTLVNAFTNQILSAVTFRLHRLEPTWKAEGLDEALRALTSVVPVLLSEQIISGQMLRNGHFEYWRDATTPFDWVVDSGDVTRQETTVYQRLRSLGLDTAGQISQRIPLEPELEGVAITLTVRVYHTGATGSEVVARISVGSADNDNAVDPTQNVWSELTVTVTITDPHLPIIAKLLNTGTDVAYFDLALLTPPDTETVTWLPRSEMYRQFQNVERGPKEDSGKSTVDYFRNYPMPDYYQAGYGRYHRNRALILPYHMRISGEGRYPLLAAGTDTVELSEEQADYLVLEAAIRALHKAKGAEHLSDVDHWNAVEQDVTLERNEMRPNVRLSAGVMRLR